MGKNIKIKFIDPSVSINNLGCNYSVAFGMMSTALHDIKSSCNKIKVFCLKSISVNNEWFNENYFLKLFNEDIIFYDDLKGNVDKNYLKYKKYATYKKRVSFPDFLVKL